MLVAPRVIGAHAFDSRVVSQDSRSKPYIRLEFAESMVIDQLIGAEIAYDSESEQPPGVRARRETF